ncbi:MAG: hypothetical protein KGQ62_06120 [Gammaproteobacteria bacterium]|nr:hypothetical protein [Gammaproteobacteria bacterium]
MGRAYNINAFARLKPSGDTDNAILEASGFYRNDTRCASAPYGILKNRGGDRRSCKINAVSVGAVVSTAIQDHRRQGAAPRVEKHGNTTARITTPAEAS